MKRTTQILRLSAKRWRLVSALLPVFFAVLALVLPVGSSGEEVNCLTCHEELSKKKVVHPALQMGCPTCHSAIDATDVPHKKTNAISKGLSSEPPELCYGCHDKKGFEGKDVHPPVAGGMCTSCHNPHSTDRAKLLLSEPPALCFTCHDQKKFKNIFTHSPVEQGMCLSCHYPHKSDNEKLLQSPTPDLCFTCHDKSAFAKKNVHPPVAAGMCTSCHSPHASGHKAQLLKDVNAVCTTCHVQKEIRNGVHVTRVGSMRGHPVKGKKDPKRPNEAFSCVSCHTPHSSDWVKLFRYEANSAFELCVQCHKK